MANEPTKPAEPKSFLQERLFPIFVIAELLTMLLSLLDDFDKFATAIKANIYLLLILLWLSAMVFLYKSKFQRKILKTVLYTILSLVFAFALAYRYWETKIRETDPAENPELHVNNNILDLFVNRAYAQVKNHPTFKISEFYLNDQLCSFHEEMESKFGAGPSIYRTFSFNQDVNVAFSKGDCTGFNGNRPIKRVLPLLQKRLDQISRPDLKQYISTPEDLSRIIAKRGDIFSKIIFTEEEILKMKTQDPDNYEIVKDWLIKCVGIYNPVITLSIQNTADKSIVISKVIYQVIEVGQVLGGESGPLYPIMTYDHILYHSKGNQPHQLIPSLKVAKDDAVSFNIRLTPAIKQPGLAYYLKIRVEDTDGNYQTTEPFQIIMSKK